MNTTTEDKLTPEMILAAVDELRPYKLYGTHKCIEAVKDELPYCVQPIEVPDSYMPEGMKNELIIVDIREYKKEVMGGERT